MEPLIIASGKEYRGKYVAVRSFVDNSVVSAGDSVCDVVDRAMECGVDSPVIVHVPAKKTLRLFNVF